MGANGESNLQPSTVNTKPRMLRELLARRVSVPHRAVTLIVSTRRQDPSSMPGKPRTRLEEILS